MRQFETVVDGLVRVGEQLTDLAVAEVVQKKLLVGLEQAAEVCRLAACGTQKFHPASHRAEMLALICSASLR